MMVEMFAQVGPVGSAPECIRKNGFQRVQLIRRRFSGGRRGFLDPAAYLSLVSDVLFSELFFQIMLLTWDLVSVKEN